ARAGGYWRGGEAERYAHRKHVVQRKTTGRFASGGISAAEHPCFIAKQRQRRGRQDCLGALCSSSRGPHVSAYGGFRVASDHRFGAGGVASRSHRRAIAQALQRARRTARTASALSRNDQK